VASNGLPGGATQPQRPPVHLEGEVIVLREKRLEDAQDDYGWRADPDLAIYDAVPPLKMNYEDFLRIFREELRFPPPRQETLSIIDQEGLHIGNCMFYDLDESRGQAELGIMIGRRDYWSQGYGRDAVATMLRYMFEQRNLKRVYLHTLTWNVRAQKAFQKCGFTPVREVLRNGHNFVLMEVVRDQALREEGLQPVAQEDKTAQ
jgi:RimJ/RimL family protein N-acetyltransferase